MKIFTTGEKIWMASLILFIVWVLIGFHMNIPCLNTSLIGSVGMIIFVILANLLRFFDWKYISNKMKAAAKKGITIKTYGDF